MVHPPSQGVTANEGEPLDIIVEFCAEPSYTSVFWTSKEHVYTAGAPSRDGVQALAIEVNLRAFLFAVSYKCIKMYTEEEKDLVELTRRLVRCKRIWKSG